MSKSFLVTRPDYEITTKYLYHWTQKIIDFAKQKNITYYDLSRHKACKNIFDSFLHKKHPKFIFINGHGSVSALIGHDGEYLISAKDNLEVFSGCITYARSCQSANVLGHAMVTAGVLAYIGYDRDFVFFHSSQYASAPIRDPAAKIFLAPSNLIVTTLLKGHTTKEANRRSLRAMRKNLRKILAIGDYGQQDMAPFLWSNINAQVVIGDGNAKLD